MARLATVVLLAGCFLISVAGCSKPSSPPAGTAAASVEIQATGSGDAAVAALLRESGLIVKTFRITCHDRTKRLATSIELWQKGKLIRTEKGGWLGPNPETVDLTVVIKEAPPSAAPSSEPRVVKAELRVGNGGVESVSNFEFPVAADVPTTGAGHGSTSDVGPATKDYTMFFVSKGSITGDPESDEHIPWGLVVKARFVNVADDPQ
jgi:hypothetical protein